MAESHRALALLSTELARGLSVTPPRASLLPAAMNWSYRLVMDSPSSLVMT